MILKLNNRPVEVEFEANSGEMEDIFISNGVYEDTGEELTEEELDALQDQNQDALYEAWMDMKISASDFMEYD